MNWLLQLLTIFSFHAPPPPVVLHVLTPPPVVQQHHQATVQSTPQFVDTENESQCPVAEVRWVSSDGSTQLYPDCYYNHPGQVEACITYNADGTWSTVALLNPTGPNCGNGGFEGSVMEDAING